MELVHKRTFLRLSPQQGDGGVLRFDAVDEDWVLRGKIGGLPLTRRVVRVLPGRQSDLEAFQFHVADAELRGEEVAPGYRHGQLGDLNQGRDVGAIAVRQGDSGNGSAGKRGKGEVKVGEGDATLKLLAEGAFETIANNGRHGRAQQDSGADRKQGQKTYGSKQNGDVSFHWAGATAKREQDRGKLGPGPAGCRSLRLPMGAGLFETRIQVFGGTGGIGRRFGKDFRGGNVTSVDAAIGIFIGTEGGAFERNAGKNAASAGIAEHLGSHVGVGFRGSGATLGPGCNRSVAAELDFAVKQAFGTAIVHDQNDEIGGFSSDLKTEAAAFECIHGGSAPGSVIILAGAANHDPASVTAAGDECSFQDRGHNHNTAGFVEDVLRNVVGNVENFLNDRTCILNTVVIFRLVVCGLRQNIGTGQKQTNEEQLP